MLTLLFSPQTMPKIFFFWGFEKQTVSPAACRANRGLVRLAMKSFQGAVEDLQVGQNGHSCGDEQNTTHPKDNENGGDGPAKGPQAPTGERVARGGMGEGALDTLDCSLGRALAEGRLNSKASRDVSEYK